MEDKKLFKYHKISNGISAKEYRAIKHRVQRRKAKKLKKLLG